MSSTYCPRSYMLRATFAVSPFAAIRSVLVYTSQTDGPLPSACQPPSTWYAAVAAPQRNPAGKGLCTFAILFSFLLPHPLDRAVLPVLELLIPRLTIPSALSIYAA